MGKFMTAYQKELYNTIEALPEELLNKVVDYVKYLKFSYVTNNAPSELTIESEEDLLKKLDEGIEDIEKGNVCTIKEANSEIEKILTEQVGIINSLEYYPYRYEVINSRYEKYKDIRKLVIDNYVALYGVNEDKKEVNILRILYAGSDWLEK